MAGFGVSEDGFRIKGLDAILGESFARARQAFGADIDLTSTSTLRKILEAAAAEDAELWKRMEDLHYSRFASMAVGLNLDFLGEDLGLVRRFLFGGGLVTLTLAGAAPGRTYELPAATVLVAAGQAYYTNTAASLSAQAPEAKTTVTAFERGPAGNIPAGQAFTIDSDYLNFYLDLGPAVVTGKNDAAFQGGETFETDDDYRARLLGLPRNLWTLETVRRAAADVTGVIDVLLSDPLGGVDVSQSYFNMFNFDERHFGGERRIGEPYFFDIVVAHEFARPWRTTGAVPGIFESVRAAVDRVRPIGIHPNIIQANHIEVGVRARIVAAPGYDAVTLLASVKQRIAGNIGALKLGGDVLYSQVMCAIAEQPGVVDVQNMHLRRCPPAFGRITFGQVAFQAAIIEAAAGENLIMSPTEIALFRLDSDLIAFEVLAR